MIAIIGAGRMGEALLAGILHTGRDAAEVLISEAREDRAAELCQRYGVAAASPAEAAARADTLLLAVKPQDMVAALNEIAPALPPGRLVISVAAGITTAVLEKHLPAETAVVRAMPNTPALVGQGMTAIAAGTHTLEEHLDRAETLLRSVGEVVRVPELPRRGSDDRSRSAPGAAAADRRAARHPDRGGLRGNAARLRGPSDPVAGSSDLARGNDRRCPAGTRTPRPAQRVR